MKAQDITSGWTGEVVSPDLLNQEAALVWIHYHRYPQHPLCTKRVYWKITTHAVKDSSGELGVDFEYRLMDVGVIRYPHLYTVRVEKEDTGGVEVVKEEAHLSETLDYPDPVREVFGEELLLDLAEKEGETHEFIVVMERLRRENDTDWEIVEKWHPFAVEGEDRDGRYLEVVQILAEGEEEFRYSPFPRYPYA